MTETALLDVNVLLALFDREHTHHNVAHDWMADTDGLKWATCATTQNGFIRVTSNPASRTGVYRAVEAANFLRRFCSSSDHEFWNESVSLIDRGLFDLSHVSGYRQITDVYLLGLAKKNGGTFVTFDASVPLNAVIGATRRHLTVLAEA